jgi:primase-polymerase (primpol)-like protein
MRICAHCQTDFKPQRSTGVYCSPRCRVYAFRESRANIPTALVTVPRWVTFSRDKMPRQTDGTPASSTNPATWATFAAASSAARLLDRGVGFVLNGDGIACIDLDHCITGGVLADWAADIVARAGKTFVEVSPSGTGLHIWGFAEVGKGRRMGQVEVYDRGRYMTVTGNRWRGSSRRLADISSLVSDLVGV